MNELSQKINESIVSVVFKKADGTERTMKCTRNFQYIPENFHPKTAESTPVKEVEDLERVFDTEVQGWRSFKPSRLVSWELV